SEIATDTTTVLLEAAYFTPMAIARTAKRVGLRSEASVRFERGCVPDGMPRAIAGFCELVPGAVVQAGLFVVDARRYLAVPARAARHARQLRGRRDGGGDRPGHARAVQHAARPVRQPCPRADQPARARGVGAAHVDVDPDAPRGHVQPLPPAPRPPLVRDRQR